MYCTRSWMYMCLCSTTYLCGEVKSQPSWGHKGATLVSLTKGLPQGKVQGMGPCMVLHDGTAPILQYNISIWHWRPFTTKQSKIKSKGTRTSDPLPQSKIYPLPTHPIDGACDGVSNWEGPFNGPHMQHVTTMHLNILHCKLCTLMKKKKLAFSLEHHSLS